MRCIVKNRPAGLRLRSAALIGALAAAAALVLFAPSLVAGAASSRTAATSPLAGDLTTYDYGNTRSGDDPVDPHIAGLSAAPTWTATLNGAEFGEPLILGGRAYVATEGDSVYGLNATTGHVLWKLTVGRPVPISVVDSAPTLGSSCGNINPLGITGTPVIDPVSGELFVAEETELPGPASWRRVRHWLVAISLTTHHELWHRDIDPPHPNTSSSYYIAAEQQRPALTLLDGRIYAELGGLAGDCGQYHGYVVSLSEAGTGALGSYEVPTQREGAIWETNGALVSASGDLYVATGNGSSNTIADFDEGNSVVELSPTLRRLGLWAPGDWVQLNDDDWDLGSSGPIEVPGTTLLFVAGKPANNGDFGYLMSEGHLEGIGRGAFTGSVCTGGSGAFGADAAAVVGRRTLVFAPCGNGTVALAIHVAAKTFTRAWVASSGGPNGSPIVAGGVVWALNWNAGQLDGMNPATGHVFIERSTAGLPHFATPAVGDGRVLVPTSSGVEAFTTLG